MNLLSKVLGSVGHGLSNAGEFILNGAKDGAKAAGRGVADSWKSAINDAKTGGFLWNDVKGAASGVEDGHKLLGTDVRSLDAANEQFGSLIDSGEKYLESKVDEGRAWLRQHAGVAGRVTSDWIGIQEGVGISVYDAGKGVVQLADGVQSLTNPMEWAANPSANVARVESAVKIGETLARVASLADPTNWMVDPQGKALLAGALWNSAATSFESDSAKFTGNAVGTFATLFIPGADAAGVAGDAARVTELATDASNAAAVAGDVSKAVDITLDASKATAVTDNAGRAAVGEAEKLVQITLRGVDHTIPDWHMAEISYTKRTDTAREALRAEFAPVRKAFVKDLAENHSAALREAGMSNADIAMMAKGRVPSGYQVHHLLPLDDGGTNATSNLVLIKNDPDHMLITRHQIEQTEGMSADQTRKLKWPMPDSQVSVWPETPDGGAYPTEH